MYFPYLYGRQEEIFALQACLQEAKTKKVIPIIEPVKEKLKQLEGAASLYNQNGCPLLIVVNPTVGDLVGNPAIDTSLASGALQKCDSVIPSHIISAHSKTDEIKHFCDTYAKRKIALIHTATNVAPVDITAITTAHKNLQYNVFIEEGTSTQYRDAYKGDSRILVRDSFSVQARNADYPADEVFSDLIYTYKTLGFQGFGDYTILGRKFAKGGGPAHAVAVHLTYPGQMREIKVKHFISDRTHSTADTPGKFLEAAKKLCSHVSSNPNLSFSRACQKFNDHYGNSHFPGLGVVKRISIEHHIELMCHLL